MTVELTAPQISTLLDALDQWEDGMAKTFDTKADELDGACKHIDELKLCLLQPWLKP